MKNNFGKKNFPQSCDYQFLGMERPVWKAQNNEMKHNNFSMFRNVPSLTPPPVPCFIVSVPCLRVVKCFLCLPLLILLLVTLFWRLAIYEWWPSTQKQ